LTSQPLSDDEVVVRRIPPGSRWFELPDRITSANFKLRRGERGLSVYRLSVVSPQSVLNQPGAIPGSRLGFTTVGEIRRMAGPGGKPLGLDAVVVDDEQDPGHAEIRGPSPEQYPRAALDSFKRLFRLWTG
jgi:hypothetical protein